MKITPTFVEHMTTANNLCAANKKFKEFTTSDICFAGFLDVLLTKNQETRDMVFLSEYLTKAHDYLYYKMTVENKQLSEFEKNSVIDVKKALIRCELEYLLVHGLNKNVLKFYDSL